MTWKALLKFSYENNSALDETGNGFHGRVELPARDRWEAAPASGIAAAIRFDHPEAKIVVPTRPAFANWKGLRVRLYFQARNEARRLNLIEGDGSFALFVEPGGVLRGTINDGSASWWGVSSQPGRVKPDRWHFAELLYDSGQLLMLSLDGELLETRLTAGFPIRPVAGAGIRIGYWPGGDARYTFSGRFGPVWIDTLDNAPSTVEILNKLLCEGSDGTSRLEHADRLLREALSSSEQQDIRLFGAFVDAAIKRLIAAIIGQAAHPAAVLDSLLPLADEISRLVAAHESAGTDAFGDPALKALLTTFYRTACQGNPGAQAAFLVEAMKLIAAFPLPPGRWTDLVDRYPELCSSSVPSVESRVPDQYHDEDGAWIETLIDRFCSVSIAGQRPTAPKSGGCLGGRAEPSPQASGAASVHVHVHCHESKGGAA